MAITESLFISARPPGCSSQEILDSRLLYPIWEIIELKVVAKLIIKREGAPGSLSWDPDGQSFTIGHDRKLKLFVFCETHCKATKLVQERLDEMMLRLEEEVNIDEIQDDLYSRM
jgi:hypothetical protein